MEGLEVEELVIVNVQKDDQEFGRTWCPARIVGKQGKKYLVKYYTAKGPTLISYL